MRDKGYDFFRQDKFCPNLFAVNYDLTDLPPSTRFELVTAFEVFEHLADPRQEAQRMLELSDSVFLTTEIVPATPIARPEDWWYFAPETGQHISFFSVKALEILAGQVGCHLWTNHLTGTPAHSKRAEDQSLRVQWRSDSPTSWSELCERSDFANSNR
jgi:hypothetical protein